MKAFHVAHSRFIGWCGSKVLLQEGVPCSNVGTVVDNMFFVRINRRKNANDNIPVIIFGVEELIFIEFKCKREKRVPGKLCIYRSFPEIFITRVIYPAMRAHTRYKVILGDKGGKAY